MKKLISMILACAMAFSMCVANAAGPKISGTSVDARCGDTVEMSFSFANNPGIAEADIMLSWDKSVLTLTGDVEAGDIFDNGTMNTDTATAGKLFVTWSNASDVAADGELFTITFEVADNANISNYFISIGVNSLTNAAGETVRTGLSLPNVSVIGDAVEEPTETPTVATPTPTRKPQTGGGGGGTISTPKPTETPTVTPTEEPTKAPSGSGNDIFKPAFTDVKETDWYYDSVRYVYVNGLMNGTSDTEFAPATSLTRAMLVTVLYRADGEPAVNKSIPFGDIEAGTYYTNAVIWAEQNGIVNGVDEGVFAPHDNITREQIATIMYRYAQYKGTAPTGAWAIRLDYNDLATIADYAVDGVMYCKLKGIMQGKENNNFAPKDNATRAEIATILQRYIEND